MSGAIQKVQGALDTVASGLDNAEHAGITATMTGGLAVAAVIAASPSAVTVVGAIPWAISAIGAVGLFLGQIENAISTLSNVQSGQAKAIEGFLNDQGPWPNPHTEDFDNWQDWRGL